MTTRFDESLGKWLNRRSQRRARGELRPDSDEISELDVLLQMVEMAGYDERSVMSSRIEAALAKEDDGLCRCGHHLAQHLEGLRCLHPVGCSTQCDCPGWHSENE